MQKLALLFLLIIAANGAFAQSFAGIWTGTFNGDPVTLTLEHNGGVDWKGSLNDNSNTYTVAATASGNQLTGTATEPTLGLAFELKASVEGATMSLKLLFLGVEMPMTLTKSGAPASPQPTNSTQNAVPQTSATMPNLPKNAQHDPALVGMWAAEENYNSGAAYGGGGYSSQSFLAFNADGTLSDLGGQTTVGGSDFSGQSTSAATGLVPGVKWYTEGRNLYLVATDGTRTETQKLGRYYIENGAMLITSDSGAKQLFYRK